MRHNRKINHLGRTYSHRSAMLSNMAVSLIMHKRIFTTVAKAKELRIYIEPIITKSKDDTTHSRRLTFQKLRNKYAVTELFQEISQKVADRPGGYTRIIKTGNRLGDNASMCFIELVDYNELMLQEKGDKKTAKTRRSRRGGGAAKATASTAAPAAGKPAKETKAKEEVVEETPAVVETPVVEEPAVIEEPVAETPVVEEPVAETPEAEATPEEEPKAE